MNSKMIAGGGLLRGKVFNKIVLLSVTAALVVGGFFVSSVAKADGLCTSGVPAVDLLLVNATQNVTNDVDSGKNGNWALEDYTKTIQVWLDSDGSTYCAQVNYNGTFRTPAGVLSPEAGALITQNINGTMIGGYRASIVGTPLSSLGTIPPTFDYLGSLSNLSAGVIPPSVSWLDATFSSGYNFNYLNNGNDWSWTYTTTGNNPHSTWINAGTGSHGDIGPVVNATTSTGYSTIQAAVSAATPGDTINVAAGTYTEVGQIVIDKDLTIVGADKATTIIKPAQDTGGSGDARGWFLVPAGITFNLSNVTLDGTGKLIFMGLYYWGNGTVNNVNVSNIKYNESSSYEGRGMIIKGNVNVTNSTFTQMGRIGVQYFGGGGTASGDTFTGKGNGNWLDYAFDIDNGAVVTISNNTITGNTGVATIDHSTSAGILVTTYYGSGTTATITGNTITGNTDGIAVGYDASDASTVTAHKNNLSGNTGTGLTSTSSHAVDAANNYWGSTSPVFSTIISGNVTYSPWFSDAAKTTLRYTTASGSGNTTTTTTGSSVTTITGESTGNGSVTVTADIPSGTIITGDSSWDGTITPPTTTTATVTVAGFDTTVTSAITIGSSLSDLTFDKAVKLTFAGQTGKHIGWYNHANVFTEIIASCAANDQTTGDALVAGTFCKIDAGSDLVVWTKHFSTFTTYTQTTNSVQGGGGGQLTTSGGGGSSSYVAPVVTTSTPTPVVITTPAPVGQVLGASTGPTIILGCANRTIGFSTTSGQSCTGNTGATGQVLGAQSFHFSLMLKKGATGDEVTQLQNFLTTLGYTLTADGKFGAKTKAAVIKFEVANKLKGDGVVGPKVRALLNE